MTSVGIPLTHFSDQYFSRCSITAAQPHDTVLGSCSSYTNCTCAMVRPPTVSWYACGLCASSMASPAGEPTRSHTVRSAVRLFIFM